MFKEKYSKDNEQIVLDEATKRYIKSKLMAETQKPKPRLNYMAVIAAALSVVLALSVVIVAGNTTPSYDYVEETSLVQNLSYDAIYKTIKNSFKKDYNLFEDIADGLGFATGESTADRAEPGASAPTDDLGSTGTNSSESSTTNNQVQGVDELDLVKNDGQYIYSIKQGATVVITKANDGDPKVVSNLVVAKEGENITGLFVKGNRLAVIISTYRHNYSNTKLVIFDISSKEDVKEVKAINQNGYYNNSRMIGDKIYLLSNHRVYNDISKNKVETYVPCVDGTAISNKNICMIEDFESPQYLVVSSFDIDSGEVVDSVAVLGGAQNVYCNSENLYYTFTKGENYEDGEKVIYQNVTTVVKVSLKNDKIETVATGKVKGTTLNQFSMDEYEGNLRVVTTLNETVSTKTRYGFEYSTSDVVSAQTLSKNALYVLDENLKQIGKIENLAEGERVYSVRFDGKIGYFVTFRQIDPLFTVDLTDPKNPKVLSELKIPGFSEYLHPFGEGKLFGFGKSANEWGQVQGLKISMFDVSDPANVTENYVTPIDAYWSEASENHKAIMVDVGKNIIAFLATDNFSNTNLYVYGYDAENGFFEKTVALVADAYTYGARFIWINDHFYLVNQNGITVFSLDTFEKITYLAF